MATYLHRSRFQARLKRNGVTQHLGSYSTPEDAAAARERALL